MNQYVTGGTIKRLREAKNLTQAELAQKLDVSSKTISKWETAKGLPDISLLEPLAAAGGRFPFFRHWGLNALCWTMQTSSAKANA